MSRLLSNIKTAFVRTVMKDSFNRDVLTLLVVSIFIGSLLAGTVSMGANSYFSKTVSSLVGDYGEYDIIIQVQEERKDDAIAQINKVISEVLPGATLKEGPTLTGKTNLFIALPDKYKTKAIYEDIDKIFGSIPGGGSVGFMSEPRLTLRGVPEGAKEMLMKRIDSIDGVRFSFRDGSSIGVLITSLDKMPYVNDQINSLLKQYQIIEVSFPVGSEPANPIKLGEAIANDIKNDLKLDYAENVSVDGKNDDMTYMVSTMMELKRFLTAYASQVTITPAAGAHLTKGDVVAFQGKAAAPLTPGQAIDHSNVLVQVTSVRADGVAEGVITQGDAAALKNLAGYKIENNVVGRAIGTIAVRNPRQELSGALTETSKIVGQIPGVAQDAQQMSVLALSALNNYDNSINAMQQTLNNLQAAGSTIETLTSGLSNINTSSVQAQLDSSSRALGGVVNTLQVAKLVSSDAAATADSLANTQRNLISVKNGLSALDNVAADGRRAKSTIDSIVASGNSTLATMRAFDTNGARQSLNDTNNRLSQIQQLNVPLVTTQLQYLAASVPNLTDEEINGSVKLLDKFIAGQVIPGARIQILTTNNVSTDAIAPVVYRVVGHNNLSLYSTSLGVIEPDTRGQVMQIMSEVRAILAGMTSIIVTILLLVLDHTAIMTVIRRKRLAVKVAPTGWRKVVQRVTITFTAPERQYGMAVGAIMLTAMFILAKGGIPYLPWIAVPFLGAFLGLLVANYAEKISPISSEEVMAGEALGLSFDEIMREIVVPSGRPGLLQKLNQRKVKFK